MRLFTKYARATVGTTVITFLVACIAYIFILEKVFTDQVDDALTVEKDEIILYIQKYKTLPDIMPVPEQQTLFKAVEKPLLNNEQFTSVYHQKRNFRIISFTTQVNNQYYLTTIQKSLDRTDSLIHSIFVITFCTIFIILLSILIINRIVLEKVWQPFYKTVDRIKEFNVSRNHFPEVPVSDIDEFNVMNSAIKETADRANKDYQILKEFTENAAHELQTPIAVIRSKLDMLIQDGALSQQQSEAASQAYDAVERANRLNQSLVFLAKIENKQFNNPASVNIKTLLEKHANQLKEVITDKDITLLMELQDVIILIDPVMADALINNLLTNAIRYNLINGTIRIACSSNELQFTNSGNPAKLDSSRIFTRFYKGTQHQEGQGLGLSIVQQICELMNYSLTYHFENAEHTFIIHFS